MIFLFSEEQEFVISTNFDSYKVPTENHKMEHKNYGSWNLCS